MIHSRRRALKGAGLGLLGAGFLSRVDAVAALQRPGSLRALLAEQAKGGTPPYLALGDHTMLRRNMCFSEEPGLYDTEHGCGFNWSDTVVVGVNSGYRMSRVPYSQEWCWLRL